MKKQIWIIANWKANKAITEALEWVSVVGPKVPRQENLKVVVCPTFVCLEEVNKAIKAGNFPLMVGSQDISKFSVGPYTGETPSRLFSGLVSLSIVGHSERRENFYETDEVVAEKVKLAYEEDILPLVCVQKEGTPVPGQVELVAYEPVWAIGTGTPDTPENANEVALKLKKNNPGLAVLYGGSVTCENIARFIKQENIDGVLVGKASLDAKEFVKMVKECIACPKVS